MILIQLSFYVVEPLNYSSSQEEVETEDDGCDAPESVLVKEGITGVYDVTSNDEESCHLLQTEDDSENSGRCQIIRAVNSKDLLHYYAA